MIGSSRSLRSLILVLTFASSALATTVVVPADRTLVREADLIVRGTVVGVIPGSVDARTDVVISTTRTLKGQSEPTIIVRTLGGTTTDGYELKVWGAPELRPGEDVLLFLRSRDGNIHEPLQMMLGVFRLRGHEDDGFAVRDLSGVSAIEISGVDSPDPRLLRDWSSFTSWIEQVARGTTTEATYWRLPTPWQSVAAPFTLFISPSTGNNIRWFDFDEGTTIQWRIREPEFGSGSPTVQQLSDAIQAWNEAPGTLIRYAAAGTTEATGGLSNFDGINAVVFGDPNSEVEGTFNCNLGGVLAIGGPWFTSELFPFKGRMVHRTAGADVIYNDGVECIASNATSLKDFEEVLGHELGHTLGIGHSCGDESSGGCQGRDAQSDAMMRATAHLDGRGAKLNSDDIAAAVELYPGESTTPSPTRRRSVRRPD